MWVSLAVDKDDNTHCVAEITNWNTRQMQNVHAGFIEDEIRHRLASFAERGGDISSFHLERDGQLFSFEELVGNDENRVDIQGVPSPLVFYCDECGAVVQIGKGDELPIDKICKACHKGHMKQLQYVYSCACGHAEAISIHPRQGQRYFFHPQEKQYTFFVKEGNNKEKPKEMNIYCPNCGEWLMVDNASSRRNFKQQSITLINLVNPNAGRMYEKGLIAYKTIVARWFDKLSADGYTKVLDDVEYAFRKKRDEENSNLNIKGLDTSSFNEEQLKLVMTLLQQAVQSQNERDVDKWAAECDAVFRSCDLADSVYEGLIRRLAFKLIQYFTIRDSQHMELRESIQHMIDYDVIENEKDIYSMHAKLGIKDMIVTNDIELVTCVYGYTRKTDDPKSDNIRGRLKLNSFGMIDNRLISYGVRLNTEGILFDIDQRRIIEWLFANGYITESQLPDLESEESVKRWYLTNVHADYISSFGNLHPEDVVTDAVFSMLHTMSHAFLKVAGEQSGLDRNSLSEMIIMETASILIYSQSEQGVTLGALSSMADLGYARFLNDLYQNSRNCVFDPICLDEGTACSACLFIPEVCCSYFNHNLGRKYLYTLSDTQSPRIGFWDMN